MISVMSIPSLIGHCVFWVCLWNHINGSGQSRKTIKWLSRLCFVACGIGPVLVGVGLYLSPSAWSVAAKVYFGFCFTVTTVTLPWEYIRRIRARLHNGLRRETVRFHRFPEEQRRSTSAAAGARKLLLSSAINQAFDIEENVKEVEVPRLESQADGFTIAHISDLHFTGDIDRSWFEGAIDIVNDMRADIVAITGDLVDNAGCNEWLASTVGKLKAAQGVYFVLGNHDGKQDRSVLRRMLEELGLKDLSGNWQQISVDGHDIFLAGDESPWGPAMADTSLIPSRQLLPQTRILLAHSPDSIELARAADFDLMLAGHTHGGQFCVPGFGAFVCPMQKPLELASGSVYREPTLLHVSRGLSAELPLRINCRPEISKLVLRSPRPVSANEPEEATAKAGDANLQPAHSAKFQARSTLLEASPV